MAFGADGTYRFEKGHMPPYLITVDTEVGARYVYLRRGGRAHRTLCVDEAGINLDFDRAGNILGVEILDL